jgi:integrase
MAILAECPFCHRKQATKNRICLGKDSKGNICGADLVKAKKNQKVRYWIHYRLNGAQHWEPVAPAADPKAYSIEEARAAEGKRKAQKEENPGILERMPGEKKTFNQLSEWYLNQKITQKLTSYARVKQALAAFNSVLGNRIVSSIKPIDLEEYQQKRIEEGRAPATVDMETTIAKTVVIKAFDNDQVDGRTLKAFRKVKRQLRKAANARRQTLSVEDYLNLIQAAPPHLKAMIMVAYNTGMRLGELRGLRWSLVDREKNMIRLPADLTKESRPKLIPMNHHVKEALFVLPRTLHHDFVFTYNNEPIRGTGGLKRSFITACTTAGITYGKEGLIFHDIRRTVKTNMLNAGVDKVHRDLIVGHSLQGMDAHYMAPSEEDLHRAMGRYTEWLDDQIRQMFTKTLTKEVV